MAGTRELEQMIKKLKDEFAEIERKNATVQNLLENSSATKEQSH